MAEERVAPQDLGAEQAALGAMLLETEAAARALAIVGPDDFFREAHRATATAIAEVSRRGEPVDLVTVSTELHRTGSLEVAGGGEYLTALINKVPTAAHVTRYATVVAEKALARAIIAEAASVTELAYGGPPDVAALAAQSAERFAGLYRARVRVQVEAAAEHAHRAWADFERLFAADTEATARTMVREFDRKLGGLDAQRLVVIKADTKHGKSTLARQAAVETARACRGTNKRVLCVILEEGEVLYRGKLLAYMGFLDSMALLIPGKWEELYRDDDRAAERWCAARDELETLPLDLQFGMTDCDQVIAAIKQWAEGCDPALVVVDYFQLLEDEGRKYRTGEEGYKSRARRLRGLVNELEVPLLAPSQVTYNADTKTWNAMGARALEQEASLVMQLAMLRDTETEKMTDTGILSCQHSRLTPSFGKVALRARLQYGRFMDTVDGASLEAAERHAGDARR